MSAAANRECEGKVAIVTGASRGIGAAIAERLAEAGAKVAASARTLDPVEKYEGSLSETIDRIRAAGGEAVAVQADLAVADDRTRLVEQTVDELGPVDILVNNGAITYYMPFTEFTEKRWRLMFEVQVRAPYELAQMVVPGMRERGAGWILNISSRAGIHPPGPAVRADLEGLRLLHLRHGQGRARPVLHRPRRRGLDRQHRRQLAVTVGQRRHPGRQHPRPRRVRSSSRTSR